MKVWKMMIACLLVAFLLMAAPAAFATEEETLDTVKLEELLEIASHAQEHNYTAESWQQLQDAVTAANEAIASGSQLKVNHAVSQLATALSQLTSMDYSRLDPIVEEAEAYIQATFTDWMQLFTILMEYQNLYGSGDQAAVDAAVQNIRECLDKLQENVAAPQPGNPDPGQPAPDQSLQPQQPAESTATLWIILLCVSAAGNIVLAAFLVLPKIRKKSEQVDDMPLVEYDIDDDVV